MRDGKGRVSLPIKWPCLELLQGCYNQDWSLDMNANSIVVMVISLGIALVSLGCGGLSEEAEEHLEN